MIKVESLTVSEFRGIRDITLPLSLCRAVTKPSSEAPPFVVARAA
jgi:hypothetical protein